MRNIVSAVAVAALLTGGALITAANTYAQQGSKGQSGSNDVQKSQYQGQKDTTGTKSGTGSSTGSQTGQTGQTGQSGTGMGTTTGGAYPGTGSGTKTGGTVDKSKVQSMAMNWPQASRKALEATVQKYGMPTEMTNTMAVWKNSGPFLKTVVFSEEIPHRFPKPHSDVLEQTIYYRVPPDRFDDLAQFDGSIKADRTKGTLSARCDSEANNILALNLANDIITGAKSVEEARQFLATTAASATPGTGQPGQGGGQGQTGQNADYTRTLRFQVQMAGTADPDQPNAQTTQFGDEDEKK